MNLTWFEPTDIATGGSTGGLIRKVLLANADTLCAAASPLMDLDDSSLYVDAVMSSELCILDGSTVRKIVRVSY